MSFLDLKGKTFLVVGVANRKSVAFSVAKLLEEEGARIIYSVRRKANSKAFFPGNLFLFATLKMKSKLRSWDQTWSRNFTDKSLPGYCIQLPLRIIRKV